MWTSPTFKDLYSVEWSNSQADLNSQPNHSYSSAASQTHPQVPITTPTIFKSMPPSALNSLSSTSF